MSDSSSDEAAPVVPRSRKRRKLVPHAEDAVISSSSSCTASSTASLTTLSTDFLLKTNAIDAGPAIKKKKSAVDAIPTVEEEEKRRRDIQNLISSSSDEENVEISFRAATTTKSPSPPPPPPDLNVSAPIEEPCRGGRGGRGGRKKSKRKSAAAGGVKTTAKANKGLKAVQQLRSLHAQMQYQTRAQDVMTNLQAMMHENLSEAPKEDEIVLKIRSPAGVQRLKQGKRESLDKTFVKMAEIENCEASRIVMTFEDREVKRTDSPASLNLTIADILECLVLRDAGGGASSQDGTEEEEGGGGETDGTIRLKIQSLDSKTGKFIVVKVKPDAPLSEMMATAAEEMAVEDRSKLIFRFDGDVIEPGSTALHHDMEDDDCVDVVMRK